MDSGTGSTTSSESNATSPSALLHSPTVAPERQGTSAPSESGGADLVRAPSPAKPPTTAPSSGAKPRVKGQIDIANEVISKVTAAAAYEVEGVADLGGDVGNALERMRERIGIGKKDEGGGVEVDTGSGEAEIDVAITVKYGHAIVDTAKRVQDNVAHQVNLMLGLKITAVNVTVDDIEMPEDHLTYKEEDSKSNNRGGFSITT